MRFQDNIEQYRGSGLKAYYHLILSTNYEEVTVNQTFPYRCVKGFSVTLSNASLRKLQNDPRISYIEEDKIIALALPPGKGPNKDDSGDGGGTNTQETPWGITRVGGATNYTGSAVAWVLDTGIDTDHPDLNVDAARGFSAFTKGRDSGTDEGNGHGTHVAGTIAAIDNTEGVVGVAAGATVIPVKVLDSRGSGSISLRVMSLRTLTTPHQDA